MATSDRSSKRPSRSPAGPRPRRKAPPAAASAVLPDAPEPSGPSEPEKNVGSLESVLSLALGVLMVVAALFPRSVKQFLLLGLGGGLLYRGITRKCEVYQALGVDTAKNSLLS